jgi:hypothetical protein
VKEFSNTFVELSIRINARLSAFIVIGYDEQYLFEWMV